MMRDIYLEIGKVQSYRCLRKLWFSKIHTEASELELFELNLASKFLSDGSHNKSYVYQCTC